MTSAELRREMQRHVAMVSVVGTTVRTMAPSGSTKRIQGFLKSLDLCLVSDTDADRFAETLDNLTEQLRNVGENEPLYWGPARKFINLFLRDATYNCLLRHDYRLHSIEPFLELPLDSHVATALRADYEGIALPEFTRVIDVDPVFSASYQTVASAIAAREGVVRVHLDLKYWRP